MTIVLPPDLQRELEDRVSAGAAETVSAYVERVLRSHFLSDAELRRSLDEAERDIRENGGIPWEQARARLTARFGLDD